MSVVAAEVSPLNCRWITWTGTLPVCTRPPGPAHRVTESECSICDFWNDGTGDSELQNPAAAVHPKTATPRVDDPLNRETCPRCGSYDVVLMQSDALVQAFTCSICHQRWLATRPWPLLRESRSHRNE